MEKQIITRENLKQIHDVACDGWIMHCDGKHLMKKILYGQQRFRFN